MNSYYKPACFKSTDRKVRFASILLSTSLILHLAVSTSIAQAPTTLIDERLNVLQELIGRVLLRVKEGAEYQDCPSVDVKRARELEEAMAQAGYDLDRYSVWLQDAESSARRQGSTAYEERYRRSRNLVVQTRGKLFDAQKMFYKVLEGALYPEPYRADPLPDAPGFNVALHDLGLRMPKRISRIEEALSGFAILPYKRPYLKLSKTSFQPGDTVEVEFTPTLCRSNQGWVGILPSSTAHGPRSTEQQVMPYQLLQNREQNRLTFKAPDQPGSYDLRQFDGRKGREEVASSSFTVNSRDGSPKKANLTGVWMGTGYTCRGNESPEKVRITHEGDSVTAVKITGDDCVQSGEITWQGTFREGSFSVKHQVTNAPGSTKYFIDSTVRVESLDRLVLSGPAGDVTFLRASEPEDIEFVMFGKVYDIEPGTRSLPDFSQLTQSGFIGVRKLDVTTRSCTEGFPEVKGRKEWFAIDFKGMFSVNEAGNYRFKLTSDDGSKLFINNQLVIDNDGQHGPTTKEASVALPYTVNSIRVQYFQGPCGTITLVLQAVREGAE